MSYDDIQRYDLARGEELNNSRSTSLSTKKFSMYTGLSPKEKIEYHDYSELRDPGPRLSVEARQPRRFSRPRPEQGDSGLPSLELTWDSQGELVTSPRKRQMSESMTTPRCSVQCNVQYSTVCNAGTWTGTSSSSTSSMSSCARDSWTCSSSRRRPGRGSRSSRDSQLR